MTGTAFFVTHPEVTIDPDVPVPDWGLSAQGRARMRAALARPWVRRVRAIHASTERKAVEAGAILANALGLDVTTDAALAENDRSATGYLPRVEFEAMAEAFFARPEESVRGWERAVDAQRRIVRAVEAALAVAPEGDLAILSHGGVGALLVCALEGVAISRREEQPPGGGGFYVAIDRRTRLLRHGWTAIEA